MDTRPGTCWANMAPTFTVALSSWHASFLSPGRPLRASTLAATCVTRRDSVKGRCPALHHTCKASNTEGPVHTCSDQRLLHAQLLPAQTQLRCQPAHQNEVQEHKGQALLQGEAKHGGT